MEEINTCKICGETVTEPSHYWKKHKYRESLYFELHFPRRNPLTNELMSFKDRHSYFLRDFEDKQQLKDYLESNSNEIDLTYLTDWLKRRKEIKGTNYSPGQFEVRSLQFPTIKYIEREYGVGSYKRICNNADLISRYNYEEKLEFDNNKELNFICDTREQNILKLPNFKVEKLSVGDYSIENNINNILIERKSLEDFLGSCSQGFDRFCREFERAEKEGVYLVILIEEKYQHLTNFDTFKYIKSKATPEYIGHQWRSILNKFPNSCQMLAVDGRKEALRVIQNIFRMTNNIRNVDLEYGYESGLV